MKTNQKHISQQFIPAEGPLSKTLDKVDSLYKNNDHVLSNPKYIDRRTVLEQAISLHHDAVNTYLSLARETLRHRTKISHNFYDLVN